MLAENIIKILDLKSLSMEGGFYKETYRSTEKIPKEALPKYSRTMAPLRAKPPHDKGKRARKGKITHASSTYERARSPDPADKYAQAMTYLLS